MKWLSRLEMKYGRYAIRNLTHYLIGLNIAAYLLVFITNNSALLFLIPGELLKGQIWRLASFLFLPQTANPIWVFSSCICSILSVRLSRVSGEVQI